MRHFILIYKTLKQAGFVYPKDFAIIKIINVQLENTEMFFLPTTRKPICLFAAWKMARI